MSSVTRLELVGPRQAGTCPCSPNTFGTTPTASLAVAARLDIPSPFSGDDATFDEYDAFVPERIPDPGTYLDDHVLTGREHLAFHRQTRTLFHERGVYDTTFGYDLARLNLDVRHPDAGTGTRASPV